jgi:hypothetical protein
MGPEWSEVRTDGHHPNKVFFAYKNLTHKNCPMYNIVKYYAFSSPMQVKKNM